jgi:putative hydrolase of the HAD superfamily
MDRAACIKEQSPKLGPLITSVKQSGSIDGEVRAVLFDIYGTLFISGSGDISLAKKNRVRLKTLDQLLKKYHIKKDAAILHQQYYHQIEKWHKELKKSGISYPEVRVENIWKSLLDINDIETAKDFALEYELIVNPVYPMPFCREIIQYCLSRNMVLGIISNAQYFTPLLFQSLLGQDLGQLGFHLDLCFFSFQYLTAKPSLYLFQLAVTQLCALSIFPSQTLYIGNDMLNDIYPASQTGMKTALFSGDDRSLRMRENEKRCKNLTPDVTITDLGQLKEHF